jgi:hypothetical protein
LILDFRKLLEMIAMRRKFFLAVLLFGFAALVCTHDAVAAGLSKAESDQGFVALFDGKSLDGWQGATKGYSAEDGLLICKPGGAIFTDKEYADFSFRFEFKLEANGNNGVGIRTPAKGNPAYLGMEIQILDDSGEIYQGKLQPYQHHGSIYGVVPSKTGHMKPVGEWNSQEILCHGSHVRVTLNDYVIVDAFLDQIDKTIDGQPHPGLHNEAGHIGFLGHGSRVEFRNIRIKELATQAKAMPVIGGG